MDNRCKICGGTVSRQGNVITCDYCGNRWISDDTDDLHAVEWANAWQALRDNDFERATELFETIAVKEPQNYEAFWGKALAQNGIVYVTELNEAKRTPTCNNITDRSFLNDASVKKAIALAPLEIADTYRDQAEKIERIRAEWFEKASREPAYDIFISYKDSDAENGIDRTQDSIDAQDLYQALTAEGYQVFFSRVSLRGKVSEQYEPYIYNALKTAKVMIVFGEKAEYFRAPWIKNEWGRFRSRIESGEKHKNSLVVVYKNMNPNDLPVVLKSRQCLNAVDITFLSDLLRHIRKVIEQSKDMVHLDRIEITGGVKARRAAQIGTNAIETHDTGLGATADVSVDERQMLSLIETYLKAAKWTDAKGLLDELLFNNPTYAEAIWLSILARNESADSQTLFQKDRLSSEDYILIDKALNCASKAFASELLEQLYAAADFCSDEAYEKLLKVILPFNYSGRDTCVMNAFKTIIQQGKYTSFQTLLLALQENAVDRYITLNADFAHSANQKGMYEAEKECWQRVLNVDKGNLEAHRCYLAVLIRTGASLAEFKKECEDLLSFSPDLSQEIKDVLIVLAKEMNQPEQAEMVLQTLKYYPNPLNEIVPMMLSAAYSMLKQSAFEKAEYVFKLVLAEDNRNAEAYWGLCLARINARDEESIRNSDIELKRIPEYNKYLSLVNEARRMKCISITDEQTGAILGRKYTVRGKLIAVGDAHAVGLNANGTVLAVGSDNYSQCNVTGWRDIVAIAAGEYYTVGLKMDGTVVAVGKNDKGQCNVSDWTDIVAIAAGDDHTVGLKADGTVVSAGNNNNGQCDVSDWTDIVAIAAGHIFTAGLKADGTVVAAGRVFYLQKWNSIVAIAAGGLHFVGLKADGTVKAEGYSEDGQCDVSDWKDIVAIAAGFHHTVGLKADGTVVVTRYGGGRFINFGQFNVDSWKGIVAIAAGPSSTMGLKADGTVLAVGNNIYGHCNVADWKLFNNIDTLDEERHEYIVKKESERKVFEEMRLKQIASLEEEIEELKEQLSNVKGLFADMRRRNLEDQIAATQEKLRELGKQ